LKYKLTIHDNPNRFEIKTEGKADVAGFQAFLNEMFNHPKWSPDKSVLLDHTELVLSFFRTDEVRSVSKIVVDNSEKIGKGKWAFIISGNFAYGMARMWQIITEERVPLEISIFKDRKGAIGWLSNGKLEDKDGV
jgi:hypothetical protein